MLVGVAAATLAATAAAGRAAPPLPTEGVVVPTGPGPCGAAVRAGSLWVGVYGAGNVLRIDPRGRVAARIAVGRWACRLAVGTAAVWVTRDRAGEVVRVDRTSGRRTHVRVGSTPFDVLLAAGSVWVSRYDAGRVDRLEPIRGRRSASVEVGSNPAGLAWCAGRIWVGHGRQATSLTALDPRTLRTTRVEVGAVTPGTPRCVFGEVWVTTADSLVRLDPHSGKVLARLRLGGTPADIVAAPDGLVWVSDKERSLVDRVDPSAAAIVDTFPAGAGAFSPGRLAGSVWVTRFAGADVRRFDP